MRCSRVLLLVGVLTTAAAPPRITANHSAGPLECYDGDAYDLELLSVKTCRANTKYCVKLIDTDKVYQLRLCDPLNLCEDFGERCGRANVSKRWPGYLGTCERLCCCRGRRCNAAARDTSTLLLIGGIIVFRQLFL